MFGINSDLLGTNNKANTSAKDYQATQIGEYTQRVEEAPGEMLRIVPYKDNQGILDGAALMQSLHDIQMERQGLLRRKQNVSDHHSYELWFHNGKIKFYMHAADQSSADSFARRVANSYANTQVSRMNGGDSFPEIKSDDNVVGVNLDLQKHYYYPIRFKDRHEENKSEDFERDPYGKVTSEMLSTSESTVVVQVVFMPARKDWAEGGCGQSRSEKKTTVADVAEMLQQDDVVGWWNPRDRPASEKDRAQAKIVELQRGKQAFHVNLRILAASPDPQEAEARARGVASMFSRWYNSVTEQGFADTPITGESNVRQHLEKMQKRTFEDRRMILSVDELAGIAHIPNDEINTPQIDWRLSKKGNDVPADSVGSLE